MLNANFAALFYLVSGVLFIQALRGLSHPESSRRGNMLGIAGMVVAILTTLLLATPGWGGFGLIILGVGIGGAIGAVIARRIPMTAMPQLVAAFHSLVGLAAVLVAAAALNAPSAFGLGAPGEVKGASLIEMSLGVAIGAITFTGSIIAFLKLDGRMSGASGKVPAAIHVTPEAAQGGPLAQLRDGDMIRLDSKSGKLSCAEDLTARPIIKADLRNAAPGLGRNLFGLLKQQVSSAEEGASLVAFEEG